MRAVFGGLMAVGLVLGAAASARAQVNINMGTPYSGPAVSFGQQGYGTAGYNTAYGNTMYGGYGTGMTGYSSGYSGYATPYRQGYYGTPSSGYSTYSYGNGYYGRRRGLLRRWR